MDKIDFQTLRDQWALKAPTPSEAEIRSQQERDRNLNMFNDDHKPSLRSVAEIHSDLAYKFADEVLHNQYPPAYTKFLNTSGYVTTNGRTKNREFQP